MWTSGLTLLGSASVEGADLGQHTSNALKPCFLYISYKISHFSLASFKMIKIWYFLKKPCSHWGKMILYYQMTSQRWCPLRSPPDLLFGLILRFWVGDPHLCLLFLSRNGTRLCLPGLSYISKISLYLKVIFLSLKHTWGGSWSVFLSPCYLLDGFGPYAKKESAHVWIVKHPLLSRVQWTASLLKFKATGTVGSSG